MYEHGAQDVDALAEEFKAEARTYWSEEGKVPTIDRRKIVVPSDHRSPIVTALAEDLGISPMDVVENLRGEKVRRVLWMVSWVEEAERKMIREDGILETRKTFSARKMVRAYSRKHSLGGWKRDETERSAS